MPKDKQKEAVKFLLDNAFTTPTKLLNPGLINQFKYTGASTSIAQQQRQLLGALLSPNRLRDCPTRNCSHRTRPTQRWNW